MFIIPVVPLNKNVCADEGQQQLTHQILVKAHINVQLPLVSVLPFLLLPAGRQSNLFSLLVPHSLVMAIPHGS
jgi:hypothetical protein